MKKCKIKLIWDDGIWYTKSDEELGLVLESDSFDALVERVRIAVPEMIEINCGYQGEIQLTFEIERVDNLKMRAVTA